MNNLESIVNMEIAYVIIIVAILLLGVTIHDCPRENWPSLYLVIIVEILHFKKF